MLVGEGGRPAAVGCAVLVTLGGRKAVGYIVGLEEVAPSPDEGTDLWGTPQSAADLKQVEAVLSAPFFDEEGAACALWLAERYAAPLSECARLFTPPRPCRASCGAATAVGASRSRPSGKWTTAGSRAGRTSTRSFPARTP